MDLQFKYLSTIKTFASALGHFAIQDLNREKQSTTDSFGLHSHKIIRDGKDWRNNRGSKGTMFGQLPHLVGEGEHLEKLPPCIFW